MFPLIARSIFPGFAKSEFTSLYFAIDCFLIYILQLLDTHARVSYRSVVDTIAHGIDTKDECTACVVQ